MKSEFQFPDDVEQSDPDLADINPHFLTTVLNAVGRQQKRAGLPDTDTKFVSRQLHHLQALMLHYDLAVDIVVCDETNRTVKYVHQTSDLADGLVAKKLLFEAGYTASRVSDA